MKSTRKSPIQITNDQASDSKLCAVNKGYYKDPFIKYFCRNKKKSTPEMNIGYYVRVESFRSFVYSFINTHPKCSIINLGAGFDTLPFKLISENILPEKYIEIDLKENVLEKISAIEKNPELKNLLPRSNFLTNKIQETLQYNSLTFYHLISFDLSKDPSLLIEILESIGVDFESPTLIVAECVFVYIEKEKVDFVLEAIKKKIKELTLINYEQINMNDKFGQVMIENFSMHGCELPGLITCGSKEEQLKRYKELTFNFTECWTINQVLELLPDESKHRILHLEIVDEPDLMKQLFHHYSIIIAGDSENLSTFFTDSLIKYCL